MNDRRPLYPRLLQLRHLHLNAWQRAVLGEGALAVAALLVLADVASAWTLLVLPLAVAVLVKLHDVLAGVLLPRAPHAAPGEVGPPEAPVEELPGAAEAEPAHDEPAPVRPRRAASRSAGRRPHQSG